MEKQQGGRARRVAQALFIGLAVLVIGLPFMAQMLGFNRWNPGENRAQAPVPALPATLAELEAWPAQLESALSDRFGLRSDLVGLHAQLLFRLFHSFAKPQVVLGAGDRLFYSWLDDGRPFTAMVRRMCGYGVSATEQQGLATATATMLRAFQQDGLRLDMLVVPTSPVLYPAALPAWLRQRCTGTTLPTSAVLARLAPEERDRVAFPLDLLRNPALPMPSIALERFHWDGWAASMVAAWWAEDRHGLPRLRDLPTERVFQLSDLSGYFLGLELGSQVLEPRWPVPELSRCQGVACFPGLEDVSGVLADVSRYHGPRPGGGRLLILSDSFGAEAAPWFARHYGDVWHFALNNLHELAPAQRERFRQAVLEAYRPDQVLVLVHDGNLFTFPTWLAQALR